MKNIEHIKYKVKNVPIKKVIGQTIKEEQQIFLVRSTTIDKCTISIPSAFSSFIFDSGNSYNTRLKNARYICDFLNYVLIESYGDNEYFLDIKYKGFYALNFCHAAEYLKEFINEIGNSYSTSKSKERCLINFYDYLNYNNIIDVNIKKISYLDKDNRLRERIQSPFNSSENRVFFPDKVLNSKKLKNLEPHIFNLFIKYCEEFCPELRLGIYLQTMAGLRLGEVVNCTINSLNIRNSPKFSSIDVLDNQEKLFLSNTSYTNESNQVKKPRYNQVLLDPDKN